MKQKTSPSVSQHFTSESLEFVWPAEVKLRTNPERPELFAHLLVSEGNQGFTRRQLITMRWEFVEANELRPIDGWGRWDRALKAAGFVRKRSSRPGRPWLYYAPTPGAAIVLKLPNNRSHQVAPSERRAAA
ncbi:MAG: hypothetical protein IKE66_01105 [Hyphomicrobium sp.]|nr:hypothetical protein [Hyphomicrobium sp.]